MFLHVFDYFWMIKIDQAPRMLGQQKPVTHSNPGCTSSSSSTWKLPSRRGQRSVLRFFLCPYCDVLSCIEIYWDMRGIYCDVLSCIEIYWDTVKNWQGPRIYQCLDLFSHSQRLARTFTRHAKQAVAFDIASNQQEDILARSGFYLALDLVLMLLELSLAHFLMFPCVFLLQGFPMISGHPKYFEISQIYRNTAK